MESCSDSNSDSEDLPVFDFLRRVKQAPQGCMDKADDRTSRRTETADVVLISSDDDDEPHIPLAVRLKRKHEVEILSCSDKWSSRPPSEPFFPKLKYPEDSEDPLHLLPESSSTSPVRKKQAKRTAEEIRASREEALRRKQTREIKQRKKEAQKLEQEKWKEEKKALTEAVKALRPEECIKHMVVMVDPALLQLEGGGTLLASVQALGCSCAIEKQAIPRSVGWTRRTPGAQTDAVCTAESHVVLQMTVEDFITLIHSYIQEERRGRPDSGPTLTSWVQDQQRRNPSKTLSLVVIDLEKYFRTQKSQNQKKFKEAVTGEDAEGGKPKKKRRNDGDLVLPEVSRVEVEEAVVHLQLHADVSVHFLSSWKDFSDHVTMVTKAVGEAPFKRQRDETGFSFYLEREWASGQRVDRAGRGLLQVWQRQIQQMNRVSADMAAAILDAYPSPQLLNEAYSRCRSDSEKTSLLSDILVRRGEGVTSTTRRVGLELSKRVFLMMRSADPELSLDSAP